jgi:hypothetical protein
VAACKLNLFDGKFLLLKDIVMYLESLVAESPIAPATHIMVAPAEIVVVESTSPIMGR